MDNFYLLKQLANLHSVTGDTGEMSNFICQYLENKGIDYKINNFGTIIIGDHDTSKIMFCAHIDQVGFQITKINEDGTCSILPIGWVFPNRLDHSAVYVNSKNGRILGGIFHRKNLKAQNIENFSDLFLYLGVNSEKEARDMGIEEGQFGSFKKEYWENNSTIFSSGIDNAVSVYALLKSLENKEFLSNVMIAFHNDEEMQNHGGNGLGYEYAVEYCCLLDYFPSDHLMTAEDIVPNPGDGPMIVYRAGNHVLHEDLRKKLNNLDIFKAFVSYKTMPSVEPQNFQNNGNTKAFNYCIPAIGYHGEIYAINKKDLNKFVNNLDKIRKILSK